MVIEILPMVLCRIEVSLRLMGKRPYDLGIAVLFSGVDGGTTGLVHTTF